jgi:hypothetical protein
VSRRRLGVVVIRVSNLSEAGWTDAARRVPLRMSKHVEFAWLSQPVTCESNATAPSAENHGMAQIPPEAFDRQLLPHVELIDASIRFHTSRHSKSRRRGRLLRRGGPFFTRRRSFAILDYAVRSDHRSGMRLRPQTDHAVRARMSSGLAKRPPTREVGDAAPRKSGLRSRARAGGVPPCPGGCA